MNECVPDPFSFDSKFAENWSGVIWSQAKGTQHEGKTRQFYFYSTFHTQGNSMLYTGKSNK